MTHLEHAEKFRLSTPCTAAHTTFSGVCLNCGFDPRQRTTLTLPYSSGYGVSTFTIPGPFASLAEMKAANRKAELHFWDRSSIRFFDSRTSRTIYAGRFFIDSVQFHGSNGYVAPREYKVYVMSDDGETYQLAIPPADWDGKTPRGKEEWRKASFESIEEARAFLKSILKGVER